MDNSVYHFHRYCFTFIKIGILPKRIGTPGTYFVFGMMKNENLTIPNALSLARVAGTPFLFILVHLEPKGWFVALFVLLALTDWLDGLLARRWNLASEFGSMLDTIGDIALYMSTAWFLIVLFPGYLLPNLNYLYLLLFIFFAVMAVSKLMLGRVLFLHSYISRCAAVVLIAAFLLSFYADTTLLIRLVMVMYTVSFIEMCVIFVKYGLVDPDTRSIFWLMGQQDQATGNPGPELAEKPLDARSGTAGNRRR